MLKQINAIVLQKKWPYFEIDASNAFWDKWHVYHCVALFLPDIEFRSVDVSNVFNR